MKLDFWNVISLFCYCIAMGSFVNFMLGGDGIDIVSLVMYFVIALIGDQASQYYYDEQRGDYHETYYDTKAATPQGN